MVKQKKGLRVVLAALCVCALVAPCALRARALEYVFEDPVLTDRGGLRYDGTAWERGASAPVGINDLGVVNLFAGMTAAEEDYSPINNVPNDEFRIARGNVWISQDTYREYIKPTVALADLQNTDRFRFYWQYKFPNESVYVLHLTYDHIPVFTNGVFKVSFYWTSYLNRSNTALMDILQNKFNFSAGKVAMLRLNPSRSGSGVTEGEEFFLSPSAVTEEVLSDRSTRYTVYFDLTDEQITDETVAGFGSYDDFALVLNMPFFVPYSQAYSYGSYTGNAVLPRVYEIISNDKMQEEVGAISQKMDKVVASVNGVETSLQEAKQAITDGSVVISGEIRQSKQEIIQNQNENANKIIQGQKDALHEAQDREKEEVQNEQENAQHEGLEQAQQIFDLSAVSESFTRFITAFGYQGTDFSFKFPGSGDLPFLGELWEEQEIPFKTYIDALPLPVLYVIRFLAWLGIAFSFVGLVKVMIADINGGNEDL